MAFDTWAEFFAMGSHGPYVWTCYVVTFLVFFGHWMSVRMGFRARLAQLRWQSTQASPSSVQHTDPKNGQMNTQSNGDSDLGDAP